MCFSQDQQQEIVAFNQLTEKLLHVADQPNREKIQHKNTDINLKWTNTINSIDNQVETLSQISHNWSQLVGDIATLEQDLSILAGKVGEIELSQKTQSLIESVKNNILVSVCDRPVRVEQKAELYGYLEGYFWTPKVFLLFHLLLAFYSHSRIMSKI